MLRELPPQLHTPSPSEEAAPESGEILTAIAIERDDDALRFILQNEDAYDALSHVLLQQFPLEDVHPRHVRGHLEVTVDRAGSLTDEEINALKESISIVQQRVGKKVA